MLTINYIDIFKDRLLIITGVGRSGTSIIGKLISTMDPVYYLYEPALMKYGDPSNLNEFLGILLEDYFLPLVQGRGNMNPVDWSYQGNQMTLDEIERRRRLLPRRRDAMAFIEKEKPLYVVKIPEYQSHVGMFPAWVKWLNVIRDGRAVVQSSLALGWFTDEWCNEQMIEPCFEGSIFAVPYYTESVGSPCDWSTWNPATRAACAWRSLIEWGTPFETSVVKYEDFTADPTAFCKRATATYSISLTSLSTSCIVGVENNRNEADKFDLETIAEPERTRFIQTNRALGYMV